MKNKRFQGKTGQEYDLSTIIFPYREEMHNKIRAVIKTEYKNKSVKSIKFLEIGCGTGFTTSTVLNSDKRAKVVAIDNERIMLKQAKKYLNKFIKEKRVKLIEADALEFLKKQKSNSYDAFVSALTIHNFKRIYREKVLKEIYRVMKPKGLFINADKYALDNKSEHKKSLNWQLRVMKNKFSKIGRADLIKEWTSHYLFDNKPEIIMNQAHSIKLMKNMGFKEVNIIYRKHMEAILTARKSF